MFKARGFSHELETGDTSFDRIVYVACDPALPPILENNATIRDAVRAAFATGVTKIFTDGRHLWAYRSGEHLPDEFALNNLDVLRTAHDTLLKNHWAGLGDPFFWRVLFVESLVWSAVAYGVPAVFEYMDREHRPYFNWTQILWMGLGVAAAIFGLLLRLIRALLSGSSRSHRIIVESVVVLALGLPLTGIELTGISIGISTDRLPRACDQRSPVNPKPSDINVGAPKPITIWR
ncbi:MAG: hypothetical protein H7343_02680 [Undibacterium sp.]|nr:hypothetical protein [Opitutaceae bacterium]